MTRFLSHFLVLAALPFLFSCNQDTVEPTDASLALSEEARTAACTEYSYFNKFEGTVTYSKAWGQLVLVGFAEGLSQQDKQQLLAGFPVVDSLEGEVFTEAGVVTMVRLNPGSTCFEADKLRKALEKYPAVQFANPVFDPEVYNADGFAWVGVSSEFLVSIEGSGTLAQLEALVNQTNTKILFSFSDDIHILTADKNSSGSVLEVVSFFNRQAAVTVAEPNLIFQLAPELNQMARKAASQTITSKAAFLRKHKKIK
ncbi:hypothetical protein [Rufibacter sp. LB8]|uniref:hypothetical protein n=1 Tax=Rufibacter sp. LB8 TaxID=2777781 RepID=UPI00178C2FF4|nr:hypothetical protein [Rufibacter sp. LB8]